MAERALSSVTRSPEQVLIVRLSALGDVLHCLPALEALAELWPRAVFDWVSEPLGASLLQGHPGLDRVVVFPRKEIQRRLRRPSQWGAAGASLRGFRRELRVKRYDLIVDFQSNLRSRVVCGLARKARVASHHPKEAYELPWLSRSLHPAQPAGRVHRVEKYLHLVRALGWTGGPHEGRLPDLTRERAELGFAVGSAPSPISRIVLQPFVSAFGRFKEWPGSFFVELATRLARSGREILVGWGPDEESRAQTIVEATQGAARLAPRTPTARHLAAFLSTAQVVVAADTGPLHLAVAAGVPVVGLYGPKDPTVYGPYSEFSRVVRSAVPCAPCILRSCAHAICMQTIAPSTVAARVEELLDALASRPSS